MLPDLITRFHDIEHDRTLSKEEKQRAKATEQANYDQASERIHNISQLLRAYCVYEKDVQYVVQDNKVVIVDEYTGRTMPGRRWSDGLHQAIEAKEGVQIDRETQTLATITIQNYFRLYQKLSGMTGTAETEANEFHDIYKLDVVVIPTNRPIARVDLDDIIYKTRREKYNAIVREIKAAHAKGQPVLVGTIAVESSELLSRMLKREGIVHNVLNAKFVQQEAEIVAGAGQRGAVTIATNMAGRGTDIKLGPGVNKIQGLYVANAKQRVVENAGPDTTVDEAAGEHFTSGLYVIGTERHESRRIDRQLRGRCARQGDPGVSKFFVSFEDDLMRNFGDSRRLSGLMTKLGMKDDEELQHPWLNNSVESAQRRVEERNYVSRKYTLQYDDVMNQQRTVIYSWRNDILDHRNAARGNFRRGGRGARGRDRGAAHRPRSQPRRFRHLAQRHLPGRRGGKGFRFQRRAGSGEESRAATNPRRLRHQDQVRGPERAAFARTLHAARLHRPPLAGAPLRHRFAAPQHQPAHHRPEGPADRVQERGLQDVRRPDGPDQSGDCLEPLPHQREHHRVRVVPAQPAAKADPRNAHLDDESARPGAASAQRRRSRPLPEHAANGEAAHAAPERQLPIRHDGPDLGRNAPCPKGTGKKFKYCCGADGKTKVCTGRGLDGMTESLEALRGYVHFLHEREGVRQVRLTRTARQGLGEAGGG